MNSEFITIKEKIDAAQSVGCISNNAVLSTHCLYDGGEQVNVYFYPEENGLFTVSDAGEGYEYLASLDYLPDGSNQVAKKQASEVGKSYSVDFDFKDCAFKIREVSIDNLFAASLFVSNASQFWVNKIISNHKIQLHENLNDEIYENASRIFDKHNIFKDFELIGESTKTYIIHTAVKIGDRNILIEGVSNKSSSVNATFVKYHDIGRVKANDNLCQKLSIIKAKKDFSGENINLLREVSDYILESKDQNSYLKKLVL